MEGSLGVRLAMAGGLLPGVLIVLMIFFGWQVPKEMIRSYKSSKCIAKETDVTELKRLEKDEQKAVAQQQQEKSVSQLFKIFEVLGESGPQVILQVAIHLKNADTLGDVLSNIMDDYDENPFPLNQHLKL